MEQRPWHRHYDPSVNASLDFEEVRLADYLERTVQRVPDATAIRYLNRSMSYREVHTDVHRLAAALDGLGVRAGTRVAIQLPNIPQTVIAYYAALTLGAQVVLTNPLYTPREIEHQWNDAGCELAFTMDFIFDRTLRDVRHQLGVKNYVVASIPEYMRFPLSWLAPFKLRRQDPPMIAKVPNESGVHRFKELVTSSTAVPHRTPPEVDFDDVCVLQYTGGTTGVSKGAVLTHRNLSCNVQQLSAWFPKNEYGKEVMLNCLPLFHVFGMTVGMNWSVACGSAMALIPNPRDTKAIVDAIEKHRVTIFPGVPALYNALNHYPGIESRDLKSVKACFSGSAPIPVDVLERFEALTGAKVLEGFGMSESSPVTHVNPVDGTRKIGTVGIPVPETDARIVDIDDSSKVLAVGEEGELVIRGPQVMKGYWNMPSETAETLIDGWLHTGDLARIDEDGYFTICGRKKDMINCNGLKVFPDEVDAVLMAHESILEAATIGLPHPTRGETVKSFLVLKPGASLSQEAVEAYCRENLAAYKVPREIEFLDELPKSTVLKVLRRELRDRELAKREKAAT